MSSGSMSMGLCGGVLLFNNNNNKSTLLLSSPRSHLKSLDKRLGSVVPSNLSFGINGFSKAQLSTSKRSLTIQAAYRGEDGSGSSGNFLGGFVLGGLIAGSLGFVYAPQISKALSGADKKEIMSKLPKFIYDEEKALEKTRKVLAEKIARLNSAIDDVSSQFRPEDSQNEEAVDTEKNGQNASELEEVAL